MINHGQIFIRRVGESYLIAGYFDTERDDLPDGQAVRATMIGNRINLDLSQPFELEDVTSETPIGEVLTIGWTGKPPGPSFEERTRENEKQ